MKGLFSAALACLLFVSCTPLDYSLQVTRAQHNAVACGIKAGWIQAKEYNDLVKYLAGLETKLINGMPECGGYVRAVGCYWTGSKLVEVALVNFNDRRFPFRASWEIEETLAHEYIHALTDLKSLGVNHDRHFFACLKETYRS